MKYVTYGRTGEKVSKLCLGTMMFGSRCDEAESDRIVSAAVDGGVTFIDTASKYNGGVTEEILGRILKGKRDKVFLATKVDSNKPADILEVIDECLARLQTDRVDLYMIHWPRPPMNAQAMMEAMDKVVKSGKARFIGCSNFPAWLLAHFNAVAERNGWPTLMSNQIAYNLIERGVEVEILPQAIAENIAITTYRPLVIGLLSGKYKPGDSIPQDSRGTSDERVGEWLATYADGIGGFLAMAEELGVAPAVLATAWVAYSPAVTCPIVGVSNLAHLQVALDGADFSLDQQQYDKLTAMFDTEVKEVSGGNFKGLRRELNLIE